MLVNLFQNEILTINIFDGTDLLMYHKITLLSHVLTLSSMETFTNNVFSYFNIISSEFDRSFLTNIQTILYKLANSRGLLHRKLKSMCTIFDLYLYYYSINCYVLHIILFHFYSRLRFYIGLYLKFYILMIFCIKVNLVSIIIVDSHDYKPDDSKTYGKSYMYLKYCTKYLR